jgi:hypothetical protein
LLAADGYGDVASADFAQRARIPTLVADERGAIRREGERRARAAQPRTER